MWTWDGGESIQPEVPFLQEHRDFNQGSGYFLPLFPTLVANFPTIRYPAFGIALRLPPYPGS